ncbi:hypothetical protein [Massilia niabensis]|uniref:Uncharacterized protein n=1 Tax=Massilia niabensis TaxID=544910 RepID=A0ABW0LA51_9BURK
MTIANNDIAVAVLTNAVEQLQSIGFNCILTPISLPQGGSLSLHVSDSVIAVLAANVATCRGAEGAHSASGAAQFQEDVARAVTEATITKAARFPPAADR